MSEELEVELLRDKLNEYKELLEEAYYFLHSGEGENLRNDFIKKLEALGFSSSDVVGKNTTPSGGV